MHVMNAPWCESKWPAAVWKHSGPQVGAQTSTGWAKSPKLPFDSAADLGCSSPQVVPTHISTTDLLTLIDRSFTFLHCDPNCLTEQQCVSSGVCMVGGVKTFAPAKPVIKVWWYMWNHYTAQLPGDADRRYSRSKSHRVPVIMRSGPLNWHLHHRKWGEYRSLILHPPWHTDEITSNYQKIKARREKISDATEIMEGIHSVPGTSGFLGCGHWIN